MVETLFLIYKAKKIAEMAPGVGKETSMMMIGPPRPELSRIFQDMGAFDSIYERSKKRLETVSVDANADMNRYVQDIIEKYERDKSAGLNG